MMSKPDTNQASEDIVDSILTALGVVDRKSGNRPGQIQVVKQLIRTEKLKLLAEVRERVVGEDLPLNTTPDTGQRIYNKVKADERIALNELEAEL